MRSLRRFIGTRAFYRMVLATMLPILLQNAITNAVGLVDNLLVGRIGTEEMSGVSIVNQLIFIFNLCTFGMVSGAGLFTAQAYGKRDHDGVRYAFRFMLIAGAAFTVLATLVFLLFDTPLISLYLHEGGETGDLAATLRYAEEYLSIAVWGLAPYALTQVYAGTLRAAGRPTLPMIAGLGGIGFGVLLKYVLIFGALGLPAMGVRGAAVGTVVARLLECLIVILLAHRRGSGCDFLRGAWRSLRVPLPLAREILIKGMPLMLNEGVYALGQAVLLGCYSVRGLATVSALNITGTLFDAFSVLFISAGSATAILLGHILGTGDIEGARDAAGKIITFTLGAGLLCGTLVAIAAPFFPMLYNTTDEVRSLAVGLILIRAAVSPVLGYLNGCYFTFMSGGNTVATFLFDSGFVWGICIPLAFLFASYTALPIVAVFGIVNAAELLKAAVGTVLVGRGGWAKKLNTGAEAA